MLEECGRRVCLLSHHTVGQKCLLLLDLESRGLSLGSISGLNGRELSNAVDVPHKSSR